MQIFTTSIKLEKDWIFSIDHFQLHTFLPTYIPDPIRPRPDEHIKIGGHIKKLTLRLSYNISVIVAEVHSWIRIESIVTEGGRSLPTYYKIIKGEKITIQTTDETFIKLIEKSLK